jgi:hypothetical protein
VEPWRAACVRTCSELGRGGGRRSRAHNSKNDVPLINESLRPSATQLRDVLSQFQLGQKYSTSLMLVAL